MLHSFKKWENLPDLLEEGRLNAEMNMELVPTCPGGSSGGMIWGPLS